MGRRASAVDANQAVIVAALRTAGASVELLHSVGKGCPDILIGYKGSNILAEIKDGSKVPSAQKLTSFQVGWHEAWRGQVDTVNSIPAALDLIGINMRGTIS